MTWKGGVIQTKNRYIWYVSQLDRTFKVESCWPSALSLHSLVYRVFYLGSNKCNIFYLVVNRIPIIIIGKNEFFSLKHQHVSGQFQSCCLWTTFTITYSYNAVMITLKNKKNDNILFWNTGLWYPSPILCIV